MPKRIKWKLQRQAQGTRHDTFKKTYNEKGIDERDTEKGNGITQLVSFILRVCVCAYSIYQHRPFGSKASTASLSTQVIRPSNNNSLIMRPVTGELRIPQQL